MGIVKFFTNLHPGLEPSLYDLTWVLTTSFFAKSQREKFIQEIIDKQNDDGTWGSSAYLPHSAVLETLSVWRSLRKSQIPNPKFQIGVDSLDKLIIKCSRYPHHETVAFEILVPYLIKLLRESGLKLEFSEEATNYLDMIKREGDQKLELLKKTLGVLSPESTISFSAELINLVDLGIKCEDIPKILLKNGSAGLSPASTAGIIEYLESNGYAVPSKMYDYLEDVLDAYDGRGFPSLHPLHHTLLLWDVLPWIISGRFSKLIENKEVQDIIKERFSKFNIDEKGRLAWDVNNAELADLDDTSVGFALNLLLKKHKITDEIFEPGFKYFRRSDSTYFCYPYELQPSPAALLHAIMSIEIFEEETQDLEKYAEIKQDLLNQVNPLGKTLDEVSHDKWHGTWTYGAQRWLSLKVLYSKYKEEIEKFLDEVLKRQKASGWGQTYPSIEESSYIISGLIKFIENNKTIISEEKRNQINSSIQKGYEFLKTELEKEKVTFPRIWISKNVYVPIWAKAAVLETMESLEEKGYKFENKHFRFLEEEFTRKS